MDTSRLLLSDDVRARIPAGAIDQLAAEGLPCLRCAQPIEDFRAVVLIAQGDDIVGGSVAHPTCCSSGVYTRDGDALTPVDLRADLAYRLFERAVHPRAGLIYEPTNTTPIKQRIGLDAWLAIGARHVEGDFTALQPRRIGGAWLELISGGARIAATPATVGVGASEADITAQSGLDFSDVSDSAWRQLAQEEGEVFLMVSGGQLGLGDVSEAAFPAAIARESEASRLLFTCLEVRTCGGPLAP